MASILSVNNSNPIVIGQTFTIELSEIYADDISYVILSNPNRSWHLPVTKISNFVIEATAPSDLPATNTNTVSVKESKSLREIRFIKYSTLQWDAAIQNTNFNSVLGTGHKVNTTSNVVTMTLPPDPIEGSVVGYIDNNGNFDINNFTIDPGLEKLNGLEDTYTTNSKNESGVLMYTGLTQGWKFINLTPSV